jgi:TolB-like protein/lipoprotein NlpI
MSFFAELKRRNVPRVAAAYVVAAWLVIQVVETTFPAFGYSDAAIRIVVIAFSIGLVPVLILAWAFELTPEGLKKDKDLDRNESPSPKAGKKLDRIIMVLLALGLGYFAFDKFVLSESREASIAETARQEGHTEALVESYGDKSIAVLPFLNMSSDVEQEYFSDGISEELLNLLAKIPELRVISRSSAFAFKGQKIDIPEVAQKLNVAHILEGSVRKAGNQVRITAQLIEARSDTHLWSETYDRTLDDVFAVQDEIATEVVAQLKLTLLGAAPKVGETDPEAYAMYLQARHLGRQSTSEAWEQSIALYKQALVRAPDYAAAWVGLAWADGVHGDDAEGQSRARERAKRALAIDPDYALAHAFLGWVAMWEGDLVAAARHIGPALTRAPADPEILSMAADLARSLGRLHTAIALQEYAVARDPINPLGYSELGVAYAYAGQLDAAIASERTALMLSPGTVGAQFAIGVALLLKGDSKAALSAMQQEASDELRAIGLTMAHHAMGENDASDAALREAIEKYENEATYLIAMVLAFRNEPDRAFTWLDKALSYHGPGRALIVGNPLFANIHADPRWLQFLEKIGKSPEQLAAIEFNVRLPE